MSLRIAAQMFLIVTIIVSITDIVVFARLKSHPEHLTLTYTILWIIVTLVPIAINFWFHLRNNMSLTLIAQMFLIVTIIVAVTDVLAFVHIKGNPEHLNITYAILWIIVTLVPIAINIWFHLRKTS